MAPAASNGQGEFMKEEQINQLNAIDKQISELLQSAGLAIQTLTNINPSSATERKEAFTTAADSFYKKLQDVDISAKRQLAALTKAGIIQDTTNGEPEEPKAAKPKADDRDDILDIGWLNTRSNKVGRDMEAELWEKAKGFLEDMDADNASKMDLTSAGVGIGTDKVDTDMANGS